MQIEININTLVAIFFICMSMTYALTNGFDEVIDKEINKSKLLETNYSFSVYPDTYNPSEEAFYKVRIPQEYDKVIFFECVNSTLKINSSMIWCDIK